MRCISDSIRIILQRVYFNCYDLIKPHYSANERLERVQVVFIIMVFI